MSNFGGFWGKLLRVNLSTQESKVEEIPTDILKKFVGGASLGAKLLYDEVPAKVDPVSEKNKLIYVLGPLTGTKTPSSNRLNITTKSPQTGAVGSSFSGGYFPAELKRTGYDAVIIEGKAKEPTYLYITDEKVDFKKADRYWGLGALDVQDYMKEDLNDHNVRISCIGPSGENLGFMSAIINEARAAGRKGVGAVMGSKNLKAVAVRGNKEVPVYDEKAFKEAVSEMLTHFKNSDIAYPVFSKTGSSLAVDAASELGVFPINNWQDVGGEDWQKAVGSEAYMAYRQTRNPCGYCPVSCSQVRMAKSGKYAGSSSEGPEYETTYSLGSMVGIKNPDFIIYVDKLCDELGLDTISAGVAAGMAMELYERGILKDTGGLDLRFGNEEATIDFLRQLAYREGVGKIFADGTKRAAEQLGSEAAYYSIDVKGLELPAYDVRGLKAHGVNFATSYTGADHNRGYAIQEVFGMPIPEKVERLEIKGKGALAKFNQDFCANFDVPMLCEFPVQLALAPVAHEVVGKLLTATTGIAYDEDEMKELGERLNNITRLFNVREGFTRKDDTLPKRLMEEPLTSGMSKGEIISQDDLNLMLDEYYEARGWDNGGIPTKDTLARLGLEKEAEDIPSIGTD